MLRLGASYFSGCPVSLETFMKLCRELNLDYIEIQAEHPYSPVEMDTKRVTELRDLFSNYELTPLLHGPIHDVNLASIKEQIRRASVEITKDSIKLADTLGCQEIVIHAGKCPADQVPFMLDRARECAVMSISELALFADDLGVKVGIENKQKGMDREIIMTVDDHIKMVSKFQHLGIFAVLDIGHAFTTGCSLVDYICTLGNSLKATHFHDNNGQTDDHLALGHGDVPLEEVVTKLNDIDFNGLSILEIKDIRELSSSVQYLKKLSRMLIKTERD